MSSTDDQEKTVYLVRHGEAVSKEQDPERPLSERGLQVVERIARWAAAAGVSPAQILHSGKLRAAQTAEILAEHLKPSSGTTSRSGLAPNDSVEPIADELTNAQHTVMIVGHLPFLGRLVSHLVVGNADRNAVEFDAGGLVGLTCEDGDWVITCGVHHLLQ